MRSKLYIVTATAFGAVMIGTLTAHAKAADVTLHGSLSDSMCQGNHGGMIKMGGYGSTNESCSQKCLAAGTKEVFVDSKSKTVYSLDNAAQTAALLGKNVAITGQIDPAKKIIHVKSVKAE